MYLQINSANLQPNASIILKNLKKKKNATDVDRE